MKLVSLLAGSCGGTGANRTKKEDETPCEQMGWSSVILLKNKKSSCIQPEERGGGRPRVERHSFRVMSRTASFK